MAGYTKFFKYINFFIIYIISFILMYKPNLELLGVGISFIINTIAQLFLLIDINSSPKSQDIISLILIIGILMTLIANTLVGMKLKEFHGVYSKKELPIRLEKEDRKLFDVYKQLYITIVIFIGVSAFLFFGIYKDTEKNIYESYFNFDFSPYLDNTGNFDFLMAGLQLIMQIIKVGMAASILGIGGYMLYAGVQFIRANTNNIYIPEEPPVTHDESIFAHNTTIFSGVYDIFRNLNINYLTQSRHTINL